MNRIVRLTILAGISAILLTGATNLMAQQQGQGRQRGGGNFDPEQMRQRQMERYKEALEMNDTDWKAVAPLFEKVSTARREVMMGGFRGFGGRGPGAPGGGPGGGGPELTGVDKELQDAIDAKASATVIKQKLAAVRADRKAKQEALEKAQQDLIKVLTARQEAILFRMGALN